MPGAQIPTSVTRLESMLGYQAVSLTNFDSSSLSAIAAGSKVEIAGAFFTFTVDETIEASTWTAITTGNTAYIALIPAGVAGSQTVTAEYTATAPVWSTSKQGWYASAGSSTRVIGSVYKAEATSQWAKHFLTDSISDLESVRSGYMGARQHIGIVTAGTYTVPVGYWTIHVSSNAGTGTEYRVLGVIEIRDSGGTWQPAGTTSEVYVNATGGYAYVVTGCYSGPSDGVNLRVRHTTPVGGAGSINITTVRINK
jgi:hypothetical protein